MKEVRKKRRPRKESPDRTPPSQERLAQILREHCFTIERDEFADINPFGIDYIQNRSHGKWAFRAKVSYYGKKLQIMFIACVTRGHESLAIWDSTSNAAGNGVKHSSKRAAHV